MPRLRDLLKPAFLTAGAALLAFGVAHMAFITWAADRSEDASLALRLLVMLGAPIMVGVPFAVVATLLNVLAWRAAAGTRLASWRYGALLASALVPPVALSLVHGPYGDELPGAPAMVATFAGVFLLPALIGTAVAGWRVGPLVALAALPLVLPWTMFMLGSGVGGWVAPFVASLFLILVGSGWLMGRLSRRGDPAQKPETSSTPPIGWALRPRP